MAGTAYELYEACESMKDLDELYAGLGRANEVPGDVVGKFVGPDPGAYEAHKDSEKFQSFFMMRSCN